MYLVVNHCSFVFFLSYSYIICVFVLFLQIFVRIILISFLLFVFCFRDFCEVLLKVNDAVG